MTEVSVKDLIECKRLDTNIKSRCAEVFEEYVNAHIVPSDYTMVGGNYYVDVNERMIYLEAVPLNDDYYKYTLPLPFDVFVSDEAVKRDILEVTAYSRRTCKYSMLSDIKGRHVYVAGKMTGLPVDDIFAKFNRVEGVLVSNGNAVLNPAVMWHLQDTDGFRKEQYLNICYAMIRECDTIVVLPCYADSEGANKEISYAESRGMDIYYLNASDDSLYVLNKININNYKD